MIKNYLDIGCFSDCLQDLTFSVEDFGHDNGWQMEHLRAQDLLGPVSVRIETSLRIPELAGVGVRAVQLQDHPDHVADVGSRAGQLYRRLAVLGVWAEDVDLGASQGFES